MINGFSDLILELFGPEIGAQALSAVGMVELPFDIPVEIEGRLSFGWIEDDLSVLYERAARG